MKNLVLIFALLLSATFAFGQTEIKMLNKSMPIVELTLNGKKAKFLLDTGASYSVLDLKINSKYEVNIDMTETNKLSGGINGSSKIYNVDAVKITTDKGLELSNIEFKGQNLSKVIKQFYDNMQVEIVGILGIDFIKSNNLLIDFNNNSLIASN